MFGRNYQAQKKPAFCTLAHNCQIKYKLLTSNTNCLQQKQITHIKYKLLTSNTNYSHQIQIAHIKNKLLTSNTNSSHQKQIQNPDIKYKLLTSKTRLNGQRSENENYVQFSIGLDPTAILFLHMVLSLGCFAATAAEEMSTIAIFVATAGKVS